MEEKKQKKFTIIRVFEYFIIYSFLGFILETIFAFLMYGVIESRKSFLYGPFCSIYGIGAVAMIFFLRYFNKNNYTLFVGGYIIGSILEYLISWLGEFILGTRWWDYSHKFLNINGRICLTYSIFWGLLGIYLMRSLNPKIDQFIDCLHKKISFKVMKTTTVAIIILMFFDFVISGLAENWVLTKVIVENNLEVSNKTKVEQNYQKTYDNEKKKNFVDKHWTIKKVLYAYPNLTIFLKDDTRVYVKDLYPEIHPYLYKREMKQKGNSYE